MSACVVCGCQRSMLLFRQSDRLYRTTTRSFSVVRCAGCGLARLDPPPSPEELPSYYPGTYWFSPDENTAGRLEERYRRVVLRDHVRFVERALGRGGARNSAPLLDVGCGGGLFLAMMRRRGFRVVGLDLSSAAAAVAWRRQNVPALAAALPRAPFAGNSFAGITMFHVLEHLSDPRAYLEAARSLLAPQGRLIVQVPNAASWQAVLLGRHWSGADVPRHLVDYGASHLTRLLSSCGFVVVRRKYFSLRDNPAGLATSLAPALDPMARRVRRVPESGPARLARDLVYLGLVSAALPFALLEAAFRHGSTVMMEARPA
jgi:SAM-dependent methyltransferase